MLQSLHIENVAVIEKSDITFGRGLTVLTGETGAGKSIVIDAINGALGERITRDIVRHGADKAYIAAVFDELSPAVLAKLEELGLEPEEDGTLLVQRTITADGKASCRINGRPIAVSALRELGRMLVNIHGQHENQTLLQAESHVGYLDRLGSLQEVHAAYEQAYRSYCQVRRTMKAAAMDEDEKQRRTAELEEKLAAIEAAALHPGEEAQLTARRELARHAGKLAGVLQRVREAMEDDENGNDRGALSRLADGAAALQSAGAVSADLGALGARLQSCLYDVQAVADEAAELEAALNFDEEELSALEDRLALIQRLCRQYGGSEEAVLETAVRLRGELEAISSNELYMAELQRQSDETRAATIEAAGRLTQARRQA
ncbi:MAG: AAA family ATPase, partial [Clostridia bacterium]|nr:AAA family ATPase [Clostridia bacterium]